VSAAGIEPTIYCQNAKYVKSAVSATSRRFQIGASNNTRAPLLLVGGGAGVIGRALSSYGNSRYLPLLP